MTSGYRHDLERLDLLRAEAKPYAVQCRSGEGVDEFDPRKWLRVENQGSWGSCGGHALSTLMELLNWIDTGGGIIQLSRMFAWVEAQRVHGRPSKNNGISIYAAVKVAKELGLPLEEMAPYQVGDWYSTFSQEVYADAKTRLVLSSYELTSYKGVMDFHRSGMGGTIWGVPWEFGRGWHAVAGAGHTKDGQLRIANSWGEQWDEDGWTEWDENKINRYLAVDGVVCYGLSDLSTPTIRPYPFSERFFG